ncbi:hypothetical protein JB92DRAFT_2967322 [Gautieria morchelliformis]|nr:hypothetical protein JB92DRAFT_2967322 [Gautieria morchelliformis]
MFVVCFVLSFSGGVLLLWAGSRLVPPTLGGGVSFLFHAALFLSRVKVDGFRVGVRVCIPHARPMPMPLLFSSDGFFHWVVRPSKNGRLGSGFRMKAGLDQHEKPTPGFLNRVPFEATWNFEIH